MLQTNIFPSKKVPNDILIWGYIAIVQFSRRLDMSITSVAPELVNVINLVQKSLPKIKID